MQKETERKLLWWAPFLIIILILIIALPRYRISIIIGFGGAFILFYLIDKWGNFVYGRWNGK